MYAYLNMHGYFWTANTYMIIRSYMTANTCLFVVIWTTDNQYGPEVVLRRAKNPQGKILPGITSPTESHTREHPLSTGRRRECLAPPGAASTLPQSITAPYNKGDAQCITTLTNR